ncbi:MAG: sigma-70 family RNA polymerase sigma factor [Anaerolineae bacterium]|nr:sigma-70 family RNA polymerase sigma factor [Anaerolineales bacterium]MCQ3975021.1 RNA polymerase subunit sigma-70 [Anaerolineae bacterium]
MKSHVDYSKLDDVELIALVACAEPDALAELYERYHRLVFSLALNSVADHAAAEEITLDVFTRVWEKAETYRAEQSKVITWLLSLTRHRAIDILRQRRTRWERNLVSWADVPDAASFNSNGPQEVVELTLRREQVRTAVAQLPAEQKEALALAYFKGYTHRQIAEILQEPLGTVKTRLRSAMQKLRQMLPDG